MYENKTMQPSMWTSYLIRMPPRKMARAFARRGWRTLEMSDEHARILLKEKDPLKSGKKFRAFAADLGISFPQGHFYLACDIAPAGKSEFEAAMESMRRWVDLFSALGVRAGVLHPGGASLAARGWDKKKIFARRVEAVRRIAEYARGGPTLICLENLPDAGIERAEELLKIAAAAGMDNVAICLDTGHANISKVDPAPFILKAGPRLKALHIADNLGTRDDHILPHGRGTVKWPEVMKALRAIGYKGLFNFEVPGENRCPEPVLLAKLDYALKLAKWMIANEGI